jgi:hypothetical protein
MPYSYILNSTPDFFRRSAVRGNPNQTQSHSSTTSLLWTDLQAPERRKLLFIWSLVIRQTEGLCILFTQSQLRYEAPTLHSNSAKTYERDVSLLGRGLLS